MELDFLSYFSSLPCSFADHSNQHYHLVTQALPALVRITQAIILINICEPSMAPDRHSVYLGAKL